ncbi:hypothetical protein F9B16_39895 [Actinomadura montaniterrae]|uniref:Nuclear transport factor 2 family protein n=1 Tax=Actinomadura montaniterrae TaxID=1803903 RepID=A0A6L3VG17_9ACTN|nr:hypothetical protein F9B16_39895 [Actinomadura montaniterrae]
MNVDPPWPSHAPGSEVHVPGRRSLTRSYGFEAGVCCWRPLASLPDDLSRLVVERLNAGDVDGLVALYEPDAVLALRLWVIDQPSLLR